MINLVLEGTAFRKRGFLKVIPSQINCPTPEPD